MSCEELPKSRRRQRPSPSRIAGLALALAWVLPGDGTSIGASEEPTRGGTEVSTPITLEVDPEPIPSLSDGNGVFEPGERAVVAPAWQNGDTVPQFLTGDAAEFTGPVGPTYTLIDTFADYGVLDPGAVASCRDNEDCYEMDISPEGVARPATHWDTTFDETLSDGTTQRWALHVGDSFLDVPRTNLFYLAIETLLHHGVSKEPALAQGDLRLLGCTESEFCPSLPTTRAHAAFLVLMGLEDGDFTPEPCSAEEQRFVDVPAGSPFCPWIEELARRDITAGCGGDAFCPADSMTRAQMAVFLLRALHGPDFTPEPCTGAFTDVTCPSPFADWIEELFAAGITVGCRADPLAYCPAAPVTRGQKAAFVTRTFGLALYGPNAQNNPPAVEPATFSLAENSPDGTLVGTVTVTDPDAGQTHTFAITAGNTGGAFTLDASTGELTVANSAALDFETTPTFDLTVEATDDGVPPAVGSGAVTVTLTDVNEPPTAAGDAYETDEDTPLNIAAPGVLANDDDVEGDALIAVLDTDVSNGSLTLNADGSFSYTPAPDFNGVDSFTYHANDGTVDSNLATVTITVNPVNDPPMADDETVTAACNLEHVVEVDPEESAEATGSVFRTVADNVLVGDSDPVEGTAITIVQADGTTSDTTAPFDITTNQGGSATLHADGSFVFTPEGGDRSVADGFTYTIQDSEGAQDTATVNLNVGAICLWLVDNSTGADDTGTGTSSDPFTSLVDEIGPDALPDDAEDASIDGDVIYVFEGDSTTSGDPYQGDFVADANQKLLGQGVDLVVDFGSGDETLFTGDPANRPFIDDADGDAVQVTDVTGVEVAGFELAADDNALQVTSAAAPVGLDFHDNAISGSGSQAVLISQTVVGGSVVALTDNTVAATGTAVEASTTAGTLELAIDGNTSITSDAVGIGLDGTAGTLYVLSFCGNTVSGDTVGAGVVAAGVIFDADPSDADFTGDEVGCTETATSVGSSGNPVGGPAMMLDGVSGDLAFGTLDLFTDGTDAVGLDGTGTGELNPGAGTGFELTSTDGSVSSTGGPAVTIDPATIGLSFTSLTSTGSSTTGVSLVDTAGSFSAGAGSITGAADHAFHIASALASPLGVTYGGTIDNSSAALVNVSGHPGGTVTFTGNLSATGGTGLQLSNADGTYDFSGTVTLSGGDAGIDIVGGSNGSFSFADTAITNPSGTAFNLDASGPSSLSYTGLITKNTTGRLVRIDGHSGGTVAFDGGTLSQDVSTGTGIVVSNKTGGAVTFTSPIDLGTGNRLTNDAVTLTNNAGGTTTFAELDARTSNARGFVKTGGGSVTVTTGTVDLTGSFAGAGIDVSGGTSNLTFSDVDVTNNGAGGGVRFASSAGTKTLQALNVTTTTSGAGLFAGTAGTLNITGAANTIDATGAAGVEIVDTTIGASDVTLMRVSSSGAANGIVLDTTGNSGAFTVTGGGGVVRNASGGTVTNTTGDGVALTNANNVTLEQMDIVDCGDGTAGDDCIDKSGGNGITLSAVRVENAAGTGMNEDFGNGLRLTNVTGTSVVQLDSLFTNFGVASTHAIRMRNTDTNGNLTLNDSSFTAQGAGNSATYVTVQSFGASDIAFTVTNDCQFTGLRGDAILSAAGEAPGATGTVTTLIEGSDFLDAAANGSGAIAMTVSQTGATQDFTVQNNVFRNLSTTLAAPVGIITANAANGGGTLTGSILSNTIDPNSGTRRGIQIVGQTTSAASIVGSVNVTIDDNDIDRIPDTFAILTDVDDGIGTSTINVTNNRIGQLAGSLGAIGDEFDGAVLMRVRGTPAATVTTTLSNNNIRANVPSGGRIVYIDARDSRTANFDILSNTIRNDAAGAPDPEFFNRVLGASNVLCMNLENNNAIDSSGTNGSGDYDLNEGSGTVTVEDLADVGTDNQGTFTIEAGISNSADCIP